MSTYAKPHLSLRQQVALLQSRGLIIDDLAVAEHWLGTVGYYRVSGYWYPFRAPGPEGVGRGDEFVPGTTLSQVTRLYDVDRRLKLAVLDAVERIEIAVRVRVGHELGRRGPHAHLDPANLDRRFDQPNGRRPSRYSMWLEKAESAQRRSTEDFVEHFRTRYDGRLPTWVVTEVLELGSLSVLYANLRREDRDAVAAGFSVRDSSGRGDGPTLANWLEVVTYTRNVCAHHSRLWNRNMTRQIATSRLRLLPSLEHLQRSAPAQSARVFGTLCVIAHLLEQMGGSATWVAGVRDLVELELPQTGRTPSEMGFPSGWTELPLWRQVTSCE